MDKELLARRLYNERVHELMGEHHIGDDVLDKMWEKHVTPEQAVKMINDTLRDDVQTGWVQRYLKTLT